MISMLKFGLNIKQIISVTSSVQLSDIPKTDAVEIQHIQNCSHNWTHRRVHPSFKTLFFEF